MNNLNPSQNRRREFQLNITDIQSYKPYEFYLKLTLKCRETEGVTIQQDDLSPVRGHEITTDVLSTDMFSVKSKHLQFLVLFPSEAYGENDTINLDIEIHILPETNESDKQPVLFATLKIASAFHVETTGVAELFKAIPQLEGVLLHCGRLHYTNCLQLATADETSKPSSPSVLEEEAEGVDRLPVQNEIKTEEGEPQKPVKEVDIVRTDADFMVEIKENDNVRIDADFMVGVKEVDIVKTDADFMVGIGEADIFRTDADLVGAEKLQSPTWPLKNREAPDSLNLHSQINARKLLLRQFNETRLPQFQQWDTEFPPQEAMEDVLPEYSYIFVDPSNPDDLPVDITRPYYVLNADRRPNWKSDEKEELIEKQGKELEKYGAALQRMGEDILLLRQQLKEASEENCDLRTQITEIKADQEKVLFDVNEIENSSKEEIVSKCNSLSSTIKMQSDKLRQYQNRVLELQNQLIKKNDIEKKCRERTLQTKKFEILCNKQEKVIESLQNSLKTGKRTNGNKLYFSELQDSEDSLVNELLELHGKLDKAETRIKSLEDKLVKNAKAWAKEKCALSFRFREEMGRKKIQVPPGEGFVNLNRVKGTPRPSSSIVSIPATLARGSSLHVKGN